MKKRNLLKQLGKYVGTTLIGTAVDTVVLWLAGTYFFDSHVGRYIVAPMISFECAVLVNYLTAYFFVWKDRVNRAQKWSFISHFWKYNVSCLSAFFLKMLILNALGLAFHWEPFVCNLIALCFSGFLNFAINEFVIFRKNEEMLPKGQNSLPDQEDLQ